MPLFDPATLLAYTAAAAVLVIIPGPGTAWIVAQAAMGGTRRGAIAALGLETATLTHATAAGLGLSAILAASAPAFETVKFAGAAYLVWLGVGAWRESRDGTTTQAAEQTSATAMPPVSGHRGVYLRSVLTGLFNPKVALFFLAFLPQFVHPERGMVWLQFLLLGAILAIIGLAHSLTLSFAVGRLGRRFAASRRMARLRRRATAVLFVGLGLRLAFQQRY